MKSLSIFLILSLFLAIGCATVSVKAPKDPIKVDISMRLDVYQHVQKDIDAIEDIVTGEAEDPGGQSMFRGMVGIAYAQELTPDMERAAKRRRARYSQLVSMERQGVIGENNMGLVVVRKPGDASAGRLVDEENADRMVIYRGIAAKNNTSVESVQKVYAERLRNDAPAGTPIQTESGRWITR
jgi:uncharacterized protein YdbL (DUF1318 family)